jgi:hypothetical protein
MVLGGGTDIKNHITSLPEYVTQLKELYYSKRPHLLSLPSFDCWSVTEPPKPVPAPPVPSPQATPTKGPQVDSLLLKSLPSVTVESSPSPILTKSVSWRASPDAVMFRGSMSLSLVSLSLVSSPSSFPLSPGWALKKIFSESKYKKRFIWIDPNSRTFHWCDDSRSLSPVSFSVSSPSLCLLAHCCLLSQVKGRRNTFKEQISSFRPSLWSPSGATCLH